MGTVKLKLLVVCIVVSCFMAAGTALGERTFMVDSNEQWETLLDPEPGESKIGPVDFPEWYEYVEHWDTYLEEGPGFPNDTNYCFPQLYVYEGNDPCYPQDNPVLIMAWGDQNVPDVNYSAAWKFTYGDDPDLRNCTITLKVHPPSGMKYVSFGLRDTSSRTISWSWNTPSAIPYATGNQFTTITINTNNIGLGTAAAVPTASSFAPNPNFDLSKVASFIINETWHNQPGVFTAPPPGGGGNFYWNAWDAYSVTTNTGGGPGPGPGPGGSGASPKWYIKWSQPPVAIDPNKDPPTFIGWDELSDYNNPPIVADDWKCIDDRPVTDIHWWGSFWGWNQPHVPPLLPKAFHIGIWTDDPCNFPGDFSHPNEMVWENYCDNWVWNFAGFDEDPRGPNENDSCFQFTQLLSEDEWFYQEPNEPNGTVYWLSIAAIYDPNNYTDPNFYPWGWKTREHFFNDDAVRIMSTLNPVNGTAWPPTPPTVHSIWMGGNPIFWPDPNYSWDLSFELTTNQPAYMDDPIPGDLNADKIVNFKDVAILANNWLAGPGPMWDP